MTVQLQRLLYFCFYVLVFGQSGCTPDKTEPGATAAQPWGVEGIRYLRRGVEQSDIQSAQKNYDNYYLDDRVFFPKTIGVRASILSSCQWGREVLKPFVRQERLTESYRISDLIPADAYLNFEISETQPLVCDFQFELRNDKNDTHVIHLGAASVKMESNSTLAIKDGRNPVRLTNGELILREENWPLYDVENASGAAIMFACEFTSAELQTIANPVSFTNFQFVPKPGDILQLNVVKESVKVTRPSQKCRILAFDPANRRKTLGVSKEFILRADVGQPDIRRLLADKAVVAGFPKFDFQVYEISNSTSEPVHLAIPQMFERVLQADVVSSHKGRAYASPGEWLLRTKFSGATAAAAYTPPAPLEAGRTTMPGLLPTPTVPTNITPIIPEWRITLAPHSSVTLSIGQGGPTFKCARNYSPVGFFFHLKDMNSLVLKQVYDVTKPADETNVVNEFFLENTAKKKFANYPIPSPLGGGVRYLAKAPKKVTIQPGRCLIR